MTLLPRGVPLQKNLYEILKSWDSHEDFRFREEFREIPRFHRRFQDSTEDSKIPQKIPRFHRRFQDSTEDFKIPQKISLEIPRFHDDPSIGVQT